MELNMEYSNDKGMTMELKEKDEQDLISDLMEVAVEWEPEWQDKLWRAIELAQELHRNDRHKQYPYIYHVLRCANRLAQYLEVRDPEIIIASILHDSVEDHAEELGSMAPAAEGQPQDAHVLQRRALGVIGDIFSEDTAVIVGGLTNPPHDGERYANERDKIAAYIQKVAMSIRDPRVFLAKVADWIDNGLGVVHDQAGQGAKHDYFRLKYGAALKVFEARFHEEDIQAMLSAGAKRYLCEQFALGRTRLIVEDDYSEGS